MEPSGAQYLGYRGSFLAELPLQFHCGNLTDAPRGGVGGMSLTASAVPQRVNTPPAVHISRIMTKKLAFEKSDV
jgi:hypothetical protein